MTRGAFTLYKRGDGMTIAEKLYTSDPDTLFRIIVIYQLDGLARMYFPENLIESATNISKLMMPGTYSGKVERRRGAIVQRHREILR